MPGCASRFHRQTPAIPATCAFVRHACLAIVVKYRKAPLSRCLINGQNWLRWDLLHGDEKVIASHRARDNEAGPLWSRAGTFSKAVRCQEAKQVLVSLFATYKSVSKVYFNVCCLCSPGVPRPRGGCEALCRHTLGGHFSPKQFTSSTENSERRVSVILCHFFS